jgi:hypothetical protein
MISCPAGKRHDETAMQLEFRVLCRFPTEKLALSELRNYRFSHSCSLGTILPYLVRGGPAQRLAKAKAASQGSLPAGALLYFILDTLEICHSLCKPSRRHRGTDSAGRVRNHRSGREDASFRSHDPPRAGSMARREAGPSTKPRRWPGHVGLCQTSSPCPAASGNGTLNLNPQRQSQTEPLAALDVPRLLPAAPQPMAFPGEGEHGSVVHEPIDHCRGGHLIRKDLRPLLERQVRR